QFANANLGNADFSSAHLDGVSFDYALLTNAVFQHAWVITAASGLRPSFTGANLQSAVFDGATLTNVIFTNAAFGVANPNDSTKTAGVWLFSLSQAQQTLIAGELENAAKHQFALTLPVLSQLQTPGPVGPAIVTQFKSKGAITLTADAVLAIMTESIYWQLTDGATQYAIFQSYDTVNSRPALGVASGTDYTPTPEFTLPLSLQSYLNNGPVNATVVAAF